MCTFDPRYAANSIAPDLSTEKRLEYLQNEHDKILDMLDGAEDCKWIYQSLIQLSKMRKSMSNEWPNSKETVFGWLAELRKLDPVRIGRWNDLERDLQAM